jgi:predicted amidophosphoribosyltransferase
MHRGFIKTVGGEYPVVALSPQGAEALRKRIAIDVRVPAMPPQNQRDEKRAARQASGTVQRTLELAQQGLSVAQMAQQRELTTDTIYNHLAQLIRDGRLALTAAVPAPIQAQIRAAMQRADGNSLTSIKVLLPETISFGEIRCVIAARDWETHGPTTPKITVDAPLAAADEPLFAALREWRLNIAREEELPPFIIFHDSTLRAIARTRPYTIDDLLAIEKIGKRKASAYGAAVLAICAKYAPPTEQLRSAPSPTTNDAVEKFLSRAHPKTVRGPWHAGFALDFHDKFVGAKNVRTELGEWMYRFKYCNDHAIGETLASRAAEFIATHPELRADVLAPIPSTQKERAYDPVPTLARLIAARAQIDLGEDVLVKTRQTQPQKEMRVLAQKKANVAGAFRVTDAGRVRGKRVLLLDDLYDSGATLSEATRVLLASGAREVCVLTITKTIHSE